MRKRMENLHKAQVTLLPGHVDRGLDADGAVELRSSKKKKGDGALNFLANNLINARAADGQLAIDFYKGGSRKLFLVVEEAKVDYLAPGLFPQVELTQRYPPVLNPHVRE